VPAGSPGPITPAAVEINAQHILTDMAGRVVTAGISPEAALKEAHARVEEIYKARRS
jgi:ABC-type glycerol-3-phosphate transport system substrate-binding protein